MRSVSERIFRINRQDLREPSMAKTGKKDEYQKRKNVRPVIGAKTRRKKGKTKESGRKDNEFWKARPRTTVYRKARNLGRQDQEIRKSGPRSLEGTHDQGVRKARPKTTTQGKEILKARQKNRSLEWKT